MTQVFFLTGATSFADPGNWNPVNTVEVVGAGGDATRGRTQPPCPFYCAGVGGCGGGYGRGTNRMDPFPVALLIGAHGTYLTGGTPYYSNWADPGGGSVGTGNATRGAVYAGNAGSGSQNSPNYPGVAGGPDAGFAGGQGGNYAAFTTYYGAGGGGAGGPHGVGSGGANAAATLTVGGASDGGTVPGGSTAGAAGASGTQWDSSHGTGGGGAGNTGAGLGGAGGSFGGGAAGNGNSNSTVNAGGNGLIIVTYTPASPAKTQGLYMA